jgi:formylglycine-generating enzyme required for sulfatase activity
LKIHAYTPALIVALMLPFCAQAARVIEPVMAAIPAGQFMMGSATAAPAAQGSMWDGPAHKVAVKAFKMSKFELTVGEFRQFIAATSYSPAGMGDAKDGCWKWVKPGDGPMPGMPLAVKPGSWSTPAYAPSEHHPVMCVSWDDAHAYAAWLSKSTGKTYRLPSEAEWEYAARAGGDAKFASGDDLKGICRVANTFDTSAKAAFLRDLGWNRKDAECDDQAEYTTVVGMYEPNAFGLYDMAGNVDEYVEDCQHLDYVGAPADGSAWTANCVGSRGETMIMRRGGSYASRDADLGWTVREHAGKSNLSSMGEGIRLVQQIDSAADLRTAPNPFEAELAKAQQAERARRAALPVARQGK